MSATLQFDSFDQTNVRERSVLTLPAVAGASSVTLANTQGFEAGHTILIGPPGRDGCEQAVIQAVTSATVLELASPLTLNHTASEPATSVIGSYIHIYRAANIDNTPPDDSAFSVLATREVDVDQTSTYYVDSNGGSDWWYKFTYFDPTLNVETDIADTDAVRGSDFGHYCGIPEIRSQAGFDNAINLKDSTIDQQRRAAEAEVNSSLRGKYTTPFAKPIPQRVRYLTVQLAGGFLQNQAFPGQGVGDSAIKAAREALKNLAAGTDVLDDDTVTPYDGQGVSSWPDASTASTDVDDAGGGRSFQIGDIY